MESFTNPFFFHLSFWIRCVAAFLCGSVIGWERQHYHKPAGLRTGALICLGACLFVMTQDMLRSQGLTSGDPTRVVSTIVTGVGFLGAGAIIHLGASVTGMTTAATIWFMAAIGAVIGCGYPFTGVVVTTCIVTILLPLRKLERYLFPDSSETDQTPPA